MSFRGSSVSIQSPKCSNVKLGQTVSSCVSHFMDENGELSASTSIYNFFLKLDPFLPADNGHLSSVPKVAVVEKFYT